MSHRTSALIKAFDNTLVTFTFAYTSYIYHFAFCKDINFNFLT